MTSRKPSAWRTYEEVARYLLNEMAAEFGLDRVEAKRTIVGVNSGTEWEIDAKGVRAEDGAIVIVECRAHSSRLTQEAIGALAYRILDTNAGGGIIVSPLGLQYGAKRVAAASGIIVVRLRVDSTATEYLMQFLNKICLGIPHESFTVSCSIVAASLESVPENNSANKDWDRLSESPE